MSGFAALDCLARAHELTGDRRWLDAGLRTVEAYLASNPGYYHAPTQNSFPTPVPEGKPFAVGYRNFITYLRALDEAGLLAQFDFQLPLPPVIA